MERKEIFANVSFGGEWSERIVGDERKTAALQGISSAVERTADEDLRGDVQLAEMLEVLCARHPKGTEMKRSWDKALSLPTPFERVRELERVVKNIRNWLR